MRKTFFIVLVLFCSCQHRYENCSQPTVKVSGIIALTGFIPADIDTTIISYFPNDSFTTADKVDTLLYSSVAGADSVLYDSSSGFFTSVQGNVEIYLPSINRRYYIHTIYSKDSIIYWSGYTCTGRPFVQSPDSISVNGVQIADSFENGAASVFFISK